MNQDPPSKTPDPPSKTPDPLSKVQDTLSRTKVQDTLSRTKVMDYLDRTKEALGKLDHRSPVPSHLRKVAEDFEAMAGAYHADGRYFLDQGDLINAFACANYAHGWLDAGVRLGLWDVGQDDSLFTLSE